ncbi:hypothetical protein B566_EDAN012659, partial [Ephemera danica]
MSKHGTTTIRQLPAASGFWRGIHSNRTCTWGRILCPPVTPTITRRCTTSTESRVCPITTAPAVKSCAGRETIVSDILSARRTVCPSVYPAGMDSTAPNRAVYRGVMPNMDIVRNLANAC